MQALKATVKRVKKIGSMLGICPIVAPWLRGCRMERIAHRHYAGSAEDYERQPELLPGSGKKLSAPACRYFAKAVI
ncbi:MAG TPA: hypothetical protein PKD90_13215 [Phnomibacter sp.]|nr:hypothetical protein [Phnomibacter sp.]